MPDVPSPIGHPHRLGSARSGPPSRAGRTAGSVRVLLLLVTFGALFGLIAVGCHEGQRQASPGAPSRLYPPPPQPPRVIALGTFRGAAPPSSAEVNWSMFLFGAAPSPPLTVANPVGVAVAGQGVLICDSVLGIVVRWDAGLDQIATLSVGSWTSIPNSFIRR